MWCAVTTTSKTATDPSMNVAWRTTTKLVASVNVERLGEDEGFFS